MRPMTSSASITTPRFVSAVGGRAVRAGLYTARARGTQGDSPPTTPTSSVGCCSSSARFTGPSGEQSGASAILFVLWSSTSLASSSCWAAPREVVPPPAEDLAGVNLCLLWHRLRNRSGRVMWPEPTLGKLSCSEGAGSQNKFQPHNVLRRRDDVSASSPCGIGLHLVASVWHTKWQGPLLPL